jgi:hypothetical protein
VGQQACAEVWAFAPDPGLLCTSDGGHQALPRRPQPAHKHAHPRAPPLPAREDEAAARSMLGREGGALRAARWGRRCSGRLGASAARPLHGAAPAAGCARPPRPAPPRPASRRSSPPRPRRLQQQQQQQQLLLPGGRPPRPSVAAGETEVEGGRSSAARPEDLRLALPVLTLWGEHG